MKCFFCGTSYCMGKSFISVNSKYYKHSNASGEMAHVDRLFKDNVNAFSEHTKHNFGSDQKLFDKYKELHHQRVNATGKKVRKDATTFVDSVVSFSLDRWEELESKYPPDKLAVGMKKMMDDYLAEMQKTYGLTPVGYRFHLDEGHNKNNLKRNVHAHLIFYNYDFEKGVSPWRSLKKKDFSNFQDIAAKAFKRAGFERGVSKDHTQKKHKEKDDFVADKQQQQLLEITDIHKELVKEKLNLMLVQKEVKQQKKRLDALKRSVRALYYDFRSKLSKFVRNVKNGRFEAFYDDVEDIQNIIDETAKQSKQISDEMTDTSNEIANDLQASKPFKK